MFNPTISIRTMTSDIVAQVTEALEAGETVRLGRWTARRVRPSGRVDLTRHSQESRNGPLVGPMLMGSACPESQGAHSLVSAWNADW